MTRPAVLLPALAALQLLAAPAPAGPKPCRDKEGKLVDCARPAPKAAARCKDAKGRFVACPRPDEAPAPKG